MSRFLPSAPETGTWRAKVQARSFDLTPCGHNQQSGDMMEAPRHSLRVLGDTATSIAWCNRLTEPLGKWEYPQDVGFAVPVLDIDHVLATIAQVRACNEHDVWWSDPSTGPADDLSSYFRAEVVDGWVRLYGPVIVPGTGEPWREDQHITIEYRYLPWLDGPLIASRANATKFCPGCKVARPCDTCRGAGDLCASLMLREAEKEAEYRRPTCGGTGFCSGCQTEGIV